MKLSPSTAVLFALVWALSGCVHQSPHAEPPAALGAHFNGSATPVVVEPKVSRKDTDKSKFASEAVRNYLRDALEESVAACGAFTVVADTPGVAGRSNLARISASIISVRRKVFTGSFGPFASAQEAFVDAEVEVRLTRPGQADIVCSGKSHVSQSEDAVIVAARQFKDWLFDDSWTSVACREALQAACRELANNIEADQHARQ